MISSDSGFCEFVGKVAIRLGIAVVFAVEVRLKVRVAIRLVEVINDAGDDPAQGRAG